jgi:hypothetical protein
MADIINFLFFPATYEILMRKEIHTAVAKVLMLLLSLKLH